MASSWMFTRTLYVWPLVLAAICVQPLRALALFQSGGRLTKTSDAQTSDTQDTALGNRSSVPKRQHAQLSSGGEISVDAQSFMQWKGKLSTHTHDRRQGGDAECDITDYEEVKIPHTRKQPKSFWWRLRMHQPCKEGAGFPYEWDVDAISLYRETCAAAKTPLTVNKSAVSGQSSAGFNKQLAFDGDSSTHWRGSGDEHGLVWITMILNTSEEVRCAKFSQCNCLRSARWVALEYNEHYNDLWQPVELTPSSSIVWGEWSALEVKEVDTRHHLTKAGDTMKEEAEKIGDEIKNSQAIKDVTSKDWWKKWER